MHMTADGNVLTHTGSRSGRFDDDGDCDDGLTRRHRAAPLPEAQTLTGPVRAGMHVRRRGIRRYPSPGPFA